jgi:hypothetical protein
LFPCWKSYNQSLDEAIPTNDRNPQNGTYAIWMRDRVEADEELVNKSADDLKQEAIAGNTLLERLLLELKYFGETGKHLDINNVTACTGSRNSDGNVPNVYWNDDKLRVNYNTSDNRNPNWRSREVVSEEGPEHIGAISFDYLFEIFYPAISHFGNFLQASLEP